MEHKITKIQPIKIENTYSHPHRCSTERTPMENYYTLQNVSEIALVS